MRMKSVLSGVSIPALLLATFISSPVLADTSDLVAMARGGKGGNGGGTSTPPPVINTPTYYGWMHSEVPLAWNFDSGASDYTGPYLGDGATMTFVDDFSSGNTFSGNLGDGTYSLRHGEWTSREGAMIAPSAAIAMHDFTSGTTVDLASNRFNILNLSYGYIDAANQSNYVLDPQESSIVGYARTGAAFISKSAGNDGGYAVGEVVNTLVVGRGPLRTQSTQDYLALGLINAASDTRFSGIFVGALDGNSSTNGDGSINKVSIASYSTQAGTNPLVYENYLMVGVDTSLNGGLAGTSFAAPIVSGYAAILANKFGSGATPSVIQNRLLTTAREDTIANYSVVVHGQGEASILRAVSPENVW